MNPIPRLRYQCSPYYSNTAFYPIIEQLERAAGFAHDDAPASRLDKLEALLAQGTETVSEVAPLLAALLSLPLDRYPPLNLSPQRQKEKTFEALAAQTVGLARHHPVLMIFEDVHWIDPTSLEVLGTLIERLHDAAVLLVITYRPEFKPPWGGHSQVTSHALNRLSAEHGARMVAEVVGDAALPDDVLDQIIAKTDGVPLFVEELTKTVLEARAGEGKQNHTSNDSTLAIPATLQDSLMARLDRLESGKAIAQLGACIGREFSYRLLEAIAPGDAAGLDDALARLIDAGLLYRRDPATDAMYAFKHALIQETAYQSLLKRRRRPIHGRIADALEAQFGDIVEAEPELLAHHYTEAGLIKQAIPHWQQAGERAVKRSANVEATGHFTKALDTLQTLPESLERNQQELILQVDLGTPLQATRGFGSVEVKQVYMRARELSEQVGETPQLFPVLSGLWTFYVVRADHEAAHAAAQHLLTVAENVDDSNFLLEAHFLAGFTLFYMGEFVSARKHYETGIVLYERQRHRATAAPNRRNPGVGPLSVAARTLWFLGYPDQALNRSHQALVLAQGSLNPFSLAYTLNFMSLVNQFRREAQAAKERAEAVIALCTEHGFPFYSAYATVVRGWALAAQGQSAEGMAQIRDGLTASRATGSELLRPFFLGMLAEALWAAGQAEEGLTTVAEALTLVDQTKERFYEAELHRLKGALTLQSQATGQTSEVARETEACFQKAIEIARRQHAKSWELRAATSLARLWQRQNKQAEAHELLCDIYNWFTEGFDTQDLQEAKSLLEKLA